MDLSHVFDHEKRRAIVRSHLDLPAEATSKAARGLWRVLHSAIFRDHLREPLLRLAQDACQRHKGWDHLRAALEAVFVHLAHEASDEERFRDFERMNFPWMRNVTREQREALFPDLGRDPDPGIRDLTPKERTILAARYLKTKSPIVLDEGRSAAEATHRRARAQVRKELGFD